jgi:hypothetical protein
MGYEVEEKAFVFVNRAVLWFWENIRFRGLLQSSPRCLGVCSIAIAKIVDCVCAIIRRPQCLLSD